MSNDPPFFDVIVIGSGMGGLTAAGLLAKLGLSVLVLEQHDRPGGYAHSFKRKRYLFDAGVHLTSGCGLAGYAGGQVIRRILQALEVEQQVQFIPINPFAHAAYPGFSVDLPQSITALVEAMRNRFPDQIAGLSALLQLCLNIAEQAAIADEVMTTQDSAFIQAQLALLLQYRHATLAEVWGDFIQHPELQSIFASQWPYLGLPPSQVSFVYWATMFIGYLEDGAYYCRGGFQKLAEVMVDGMLKHTGSIRYNTAVTKIKVTDNKVEGVILASGEHIAAKVVISNADLRHTIHKMVGEAYFPKRYIARLNRMEPSLSIFVVYIGTNLDVNQCGAHHEAFYYADADHEISYKQTLSGELSWLSVTIPTLVDPSLAPPGHHIVMLTTMVDADSQQNWSAAKPEMVSKVLALAEQKLPGLQDHIVVIEAGSPATLERYTSNYKGAAYGWACTPAQTGPNRLQHRSPIDGLFFAGHWVAPGGGVYGACFSGMQATQQILGVVGQSKLWQLFPSVTA